MKLFFRSIGNGQAIIILHGLYGSGDNWMHIAKKFESDYSIFLPDMRNHGKSPHSDDFSYKSMVNDIHELVELNRLNKIILIGHSMGGRIAMRYAATHPEIVDKLIVADIAPDSEKTHSRFIPLVKMHENLIHGLKSLKIDQLQSREKVDMALSKYEKNPAVRQFLLKNLKRNSSQEFYWQINLPVFERDIKEHLISGSHEFLEITKVPALFIKGEYSIYLSEEDFEDIKVKFPNSKFEIIPDVGHWVHAENPIKFTQLVKDFIDTTQ